MYHQQQPQSVSGIMALTGAKEVAITATSNRVKVRAYFKKGILTATALTEPEAIAEFIRKFNTRAAA